jgi:oligoribonuclease NrnB/cAMP/cGMP phosphodiesterase (DHH superfamily)
MLTDKEIIDFREELTNCKKPIFFYDDDMDGAVSFILLYKLINEGKGVIVKSAPELSSRFLRSVDDFKPDKVFILDKPMVAEEFIDGCKCRILWLDHHPLQQPTKVKYYNPRKEDPSDNRPTSYWAYRIANNKEDLWMAMLGIVGDWFMPEFCDEFSKKYPDILPPNVKTVQEALFNSNFGKLFNIFSFNLKGNSRDAYKSIKIMIRLKNPYEVLHQTTSQGKYLYKKYEVVNKTYQELISEVKVSDENLLLFMYQDDKMSLSSDISNELTVKYPDKLVIIGREKNGEMKCSIRCATKKIPPILEKALIGISGYGGGHDHACGACIKKDDFDRFISNVKQELEK